KRAVIFFLSSGKYFLGNSIVKFSAFNLMFLNVLLRNVLIYFNGILGSPASRQRAEPMDWLDNDELPQRWSIDVSDLS
ncbi:MAG: hypothetical protein MJA29_14070, partial [Candidatus Omnitrophica bacterium]|nr:hypothetical protein [Candidatus Omnitrophota bacterium]